MRKFDFYETVGVIAPGSVLVFGLMQIYPELQKLQKDGITFGEFGLFLILAYVGGHLVQTVGNGVEYLWWKLYGGMPTDWARSGKEGEFVDQQNERLPAKLKELLQIEVPDRMEGVTAKRWFAITHQIYVAVEKAGRSRRVDIFNGNYGMFRGLTAALLVVLAAVLMHFGRGAFSSCVLLVGFAALALMRMHRFGIHYARELFVQFVSTTPEQLEGKKKEAKDKEDEA